MLGKRSGSLLMLIMGSCYFGGKCKVHKCAKYNQNAPF
jgi:hypothetical protein